MLSPFVVDSTKDEGYRATNTLAGTRISTSLRDIAAPVSVITKDFMNDIGASDVNDILAFQTGSEGTRDFTATTGQLGRTTDTPLQDPSRGTRGRGLAPYDITRDYFFSLTNNPLSGGSSVGFDAYNLDTVTVSRGPNSVLAGLGSPSGVINYAPQLAQAGRNTTEVSYRYGSFNDHRFTLSSNYVLVKNVFALRVAALAANQGFKQEPAYSRDRRGYLAALWQPLPKTAVRAAYERVQVKKRLPNTLTPEDDISQWIALGKPTHASTDLTADPSLNTGQSLGTNGKGVVLYNANGTISNAMDTSRQYSFFQRNLSGAGLFQSRRFSDNTYGNWDEMNTSASKAKNGLETFNISIDQEIVKDLNVNVAFIREKLDGDQINLFRPDFVTYQVDVNRDFSWGAPNPHFGETYMYSSGLDNLQQTTATNDVGRVTASYNLDLTKYNKWLGRYSFVAFGEKRETENIFRQYNAATANNLESGRIFYLGGTAANGYRAQTVPMTPELVTARPFFNADGTTGTLTDTYRLKSNTNRLTKLTTTAIVVQGFLLQDRIVPMLGIRRDVNEAESAIGAGVPAPAYPPLAEVKKQTKTYGVVVHPFKWLDLYYSRAENFVPNAGTVDLLGKAASSPTGTSKDYGFTVTTLDNKLMAKLGWYETVAGKSPSPTANFPLAQWTLPWLETGYPTGGAGGAFQELAQKAGITYKQGMASGLTTGDSKLGNPYTSDQVAKGIEFELTYNVTKNWRVFGTITKQKAVETNIASDLTAFVNERVAYWKATPGLWTGQTTTKGWSGTPETGEQLFNNYILGDLIRYQSADGKPSTQISKWRGSLVTNYTFGNDAPALKGFSVGTGLRYIDKQVIGNPVIRNAANQVIGLDLDHPYTNSSYIAADVWVGYTRRLNSKYRIDFQLRCQDAQSPGSYRPIVANSDGTHAVYSIIQPRSFFLTTKLTF
ncbi:MAG: TonB-dependent receptor plug domain-containing protein [Opitutaceae bacterium]